MSKLMRGAGLLIIAGLTGLAGCGTTQAGSPGAAPITKIGGGKRAHPWREPVQAIIFKRDVILDFIL